MLLDCRVRKLFSIYSQVTLHWTWIYVTETATETTWCNALAMILATINVWHREWYQHVNRWGSHSEADACVESCQSCQQSWAVVNASILDSTRPLVTGGCKWCGGDRLHGKSIFRVRVKQCICSFHSVSSSVASSLPASFPRYPQLPHQCDVSIMRVAQACNNVTNTTVVTTGSS